MDDNFNPITYNNVYGKFYLPSKGGIFLVSKFKSSHFLGNKFSWIYIMYPIDLTTWIYQIQKMA